MSDATQVEATPQPAPAPAVSVSGDDKDFAAARTALGLPEVFDEEEVTIPPEKPAEAQPEPAQDADVPDDAGDAAADAAPAGDDAGAVTPAPVEPPASFSAEEKTAFGKWPRDAQEAIARVMKDAQAGLTKKFQAIAPMAKLLEDQQVAPFLADQTTQHLVRFAATDPEARDAIAGAINELVARRMGQGTSKVDAGVWKTLDGLSSKKPEEIQDAFLSDPATAAGLVQGLSYLRSQEGRLNRGLEALSRWEQQQQAAFSEKAQFDALVSGLPDDLKTPLGISEIYTEMQAPVNAEAFAGKEAKAVFDLATEKVKAKRFAAAEAQKAAEAERAKLSSTRRKSLPPTGAKPTPTPDPEDALFEARWGAGDPFK